MNRLIRTATVWSFICELAFLSINLPVSATVISTRYSVAGFYMASISLVYFVITCHNLNCKLIDRVCYIIACLLF